MTQKVLDKKVAGDFGISQNWQQQVKEWCKIERRAIALSFFTLAQVRSIPNFPQKFPCSGNPFTHSTINQIANPTPASLHSHPCIRTYRFPALLPTSNSIAQKPIALTHINVIRKIIAEPGKAFDIKKYSPNREAISANINKKDTTN